MNFDRSLDSTVMGHLDVGIASPDVGEYNTVLVLQHFK